MEDLEDTKIARGYTSTVYRIPNEPKVIKVIDKRSPQPQFDREVAAYKRLSERDNPKNPKPSSVLTFFGTSDKIERGIVLEFAVNKGVDEYLWGCSQEFQPYPTPTVIRRWAYQTAEALAFVHSCGILHCDIYVANCFLDDQLNIKLGDFGACTIDGGRPLMTYRGTHQLWTFDGEKDGWRRDISVRSEIFALGCTMFFMETGKDAFDELHHDKDREEIQRRIQTGEMPGLEVCPVLGEVIRKCWAVEYGDMKEIMDDVKVLCNGDADTAVRAEPKP